MLPPKCHYVVLSRTMNWKTNKPTNTNKGFCFHMEIEFLTNAQNWQRWQYWHHMLYYIKTKKKSNNKMLPCWALNSLPQPFRCNALFSEPLRQVLLGRAKISYEYGHALLKWCRNKRQFQDIPSNTCPVAQRGEHSIQMAEVVSSSQESVTELLFFKHYKIQISCKSNNYCRLIQVHNVVLKIKDKSTTFAYIL